MQEHRLEGQTKRKEDVVCDKKQHEVFEALKVYLKYKGTSITLRSVRKGRLICLPATAGKSNNAHLLLLLDYYYHY